jgi:hypothetical protein
MPASAAATEFDILAEVIGDDRGDFPPELARAILRWRFAKRSAARMTRLAARNRQGTIIDPECEELDRYLRVGGLVNLLQAKARLSIQGGDTGTSTGAC